MHIHYIKKNSEKKEIENAAIPTDPDNPTVPVPLRDRQVCMHIWGLFHMKDHHPSKGNGIVIIPLYCHNIIKTCKL